MGILSAILGTVSGPATQYIKNSGDKAAAKAAIARALVDNEADIHKSAASIINTEAGSKHTITAIWRPVLMLTITAIVGVNYLIVPLLVQFGIGAAPIPLPDQLWNLLQIGVGGYVVGRSVEKSAAPISKAIVATKATNATSAIKDAGKAVNWAESKL